MASRMRSIAGGLLAAVALVAAPALAWADPEPEPGPEPVFDDPGPPPPPIDPWAEQYGRDVGAGAAGNAAEAGAGILLSPFLGPFTGFATAPIGGAIDSSIRDAPTGP
ncbi:hypothetical protein FZI91_18755 [Mycobacterium sp. CBMA271]|uniref:hypothetical protein n=1 Tax=unclassified Mycobacteroides TaxID=2618759 RepID=UPI0012DD6655|nr:MULTISPECIES: hypothetical protein [unclassified Mycobacteroides]MUM18457.1 hypothetical protein [Mycobacteroides sp. CBMA 326]MUM23726.1 hypothetical protein [Mycobacteroides sp. CBMA 271]